MEALKGWLILAESEPAYVQKRKYHSPKASMIIPAYNAGSCIARCIDTVLAQSQVDVEIIAVDDGSADHTSEIIDWYAEKYENVVAIHQGNSGVAAARNAGIEHAKGEYIGFVDADDMIRPCMIERMYRSAMNNNCDVVITSAYTITNDGYIKHLCYKVKEDKAIAIDVFS